MSPKPQPKKEISAISIGFRVDTMALLHEIVGNAMMPGMGVLKVPLNVLRQWLQKTAQRATELDDPQLNICMLALNLYEIPPQDLTDVIEDQMKRLDEQKNKTSE